jgi:acetylornithine deacetylase/succinyl-diaminopimelate desuccinylase-like protein
MAQSSDVTRQYSRANAERFRQELHELFRIPSLSGDQAHAEDVRRAAEWLAEHLRGIGLDNVANMPRLRATRSRSSRTVIVTFPSLCERHRTRRSTSKPDGSSNLRK